MQNSLTSIAVAIPCYNESTTIAKVVGDFRRALPAAAIYVFDNASTDDTARTARQAGAVVVHENRRGKGWVMQSVFETIDADALVVVDGDDTYHAEEVRRLLAPIDEGKADMVVGTRLQNAESPALRLLNRLGNQLILRALNWAFQTRFTDVLSGYRVFSRRFLQQVAVCGSGFETEVELTVEALTQGMVVVEIPISYRNRPQGSCSKLHPFSDGYRILFTLSVLLRDHRPMAVFGTAGLLCLGVSLGAAALRFLVYAGVSTFPVALLSGLFILFTLLGTSLIGTGLTLNSLHTRLHHLATLTRRALRLRPSSSPESTPRITKPF